MCFFAADLNVVPVALPAEFVELELLAFDLLMSGTKYRLIVCYRPPHSDVIARSYVENLVKCLEVLVRVDHIVLLAGDLNLPEVNWDNFTVLSSKIQLQLASFFQVEGFSQFVRNPTRGDKVLDVVLCNDPIVISDCVTGPPVGASDHDIVCFKVLVPPSTTHDTLDRNIKDVRYDFKHADYVGFNNYLSGINWSNILTNTDDIDILWNRFTEVIDSGIDMFVPTLSCSRISSRTVSMYPLYIRQLFRKKCCLWRAYKRFGTAALERRYNIMRQKCRKTVDDYNKTKESQLLADGRQGVFYRYVNNKVISKTGIGVLKDDHGNCVNDNKKKAEMFNEFFRSVFTKDNHILPDVDRIVASDIGFSDVSFTQDVVYRTLRKLKAKPSAGPDGYSSEFLKCLADSVSLPLTLLFSTSFTSGSLPTIWRHGVVTPVFKKGVSSDVNNYRPISLTCCCCKVMETIIKSQMLEYLLQHKLITRHQHGFLSRHSTCTQLIECTNDWSLSLNTRHAVDCAYIDFSKAFDSVCHSKLCAKLESFGIQGKLLQWIAAFLKNRTQSVKVGGCQSLPCDVISGVPQGSVIGPLLFLLFINDIATLFGDGLTVKLYADDVKIYANINDVADTVLLQKGLDAVYDWSVKWQLPLSINKCMVLHLGRDNDLSYNYKINNSVLATVSEVRDLGILVDSQLKFSQHIHGIVTKAHQRAALILRCFRCRQPDLLYKAFCTYVRPILEYDCQIWSPCFVSLVSEIESVQRRFTKRLQGFMRLSYAERLRRLSAETLEQRRLKLNLTMVYNILHGIVDINADSIFDCVNVDIVHTRGHNLRIIKEHCNLNCRANSFACRNVNAWNCLPSDCVNCSSTLSFKNRLDCIDLTQFLFII